jgi:hypothetical protein
MIKKFSYCYLKAGLCLIKDNFIEKHNFETIGIFNIIYAFNTNNLKLKIYMW